MLTTLDIVRGSWLLDSWTKGSGVSDRGKVLEN